MIYGWNFVSKPIPPELKRRFAERISIAPRTFAALVGVGESEEERDVMLIVASNGRRKLKVVERQVAGKGTVYGIYAF